MVTSKLLEDAIFFLENNNQNPVIDKHHFITDYPVISYYMDGLSKYVPYDPLNNEIYLEVMEYMDIVFEWNPSEMVKEQLHEYCEQLNYEI